MAEITKSYEPNIALTIFTVVGEVTVKEVSDQTLTYLSDKPSELTLWDFTSGFLQDFSSQELKRLVLTGDVVLEKIENGKAAIVTSSDHDYGISRMFQAYSEMSDFPLEIDVFRDMTAARKWLTANSKLLEKKF